MEAILKFNLPEESEDFEYAMNGVKYKIVIDDFMNHLRSKLKYEDLSPELHDEIDKLRDTLVSLLHERNIYD